MKQTTSERYMDTEELMIDAIENEARQVATVYLYDVINLKTILEMDIVIFMDKRGELIC